MSARDPIMTGRAIKDVPELTLRATGEYIRAEGRYWRILEIVRLGTTIILGSKMIKTPPQDLQEDDELTVSTS